MARILYAEDDSTIRFTTAAILRELGNEVEEATCAKEAITLYDQNPSRFEIILTDYDMKTDNGVDLARHIRKTNRKIPVIMLSGTQSEDIQNEEPDYVRLNIRHRPKTLTIQQVHDFIQEYVPLPPPKPKKILLIYGAPNHTSGRPYERLLKEKGYDVILEETREMFRSSDTFPNLLKTHKPDLIIAGSHLDSQYIPLLEEEKIPLLMLSTRKKEDRVKDPIITAWENSPALKNIVDNTNLYDSSNLLAAIASLLDESPSGPGTKKATARR